MDKQKKKSMEDVQEKMNSLKNRLQVAEDTLEAIRTGSVDAIAIQGENGTQIFSLKTADKTYRNLVEKMNEAGLTLNQDGIILYCNSQFANLVNLPISQVISSSFIRFLPAEQHPRFQDLFIKGWSESCKGEFIIQSLDGKYISVQMSLNKIDSEENVILGVIITDLSELKIAYKQLQFIQEELKFLNVTLEERVTQRTTELSNKNEALLKSNNDLDNFIYTASHDLRAPISNIEGLVSALESMLQEKHIKDFEIEETIAMINRSLARFRETIGDLLEIAKIQKDSAEDVALINFREIIDDVLETIQREILEAKAILHVDINDIKIKFSRKNLKSIIYNLLSNAIKFKSADRRPEIFIHVRDEGDYILMTVKDNGLGIKPDDINKVFLMFKRFHVHVEGTGIGLYIVKRIIDNAEGRIEIESKFGEGSTFKVFLRKL
jgi:PAS domain S-box-containing protein